MLAVTAHLDAIAIAVRTLVELALVQPLPVLRKQHGLRGESAHMTANSPPVHVNENRPAARGLPLSEKSRRHLRRGGL